jgi:hypothetical protein
MPGEASNGIYDPPAEPPPEHTYIGRTLSLRYSEASGNDGNRASPTAQITRPEGLQCFGHSTSSERLSSTLMRRKQASVQR